MCAVGAICVCLFKPNTDATLLIATTTTTLVWDGACVSTSPSLSPKPLFDWLTFLLCSACWQHLPVLTYSPGTVENRQKTQRGNSSIVYPASLESQRNERSPLLR